MLVHVTAANGDETTDMTACRSRVLHRLRHAWRCRAVRSTDVNEQNAQSRSADLKCTVKC
jgi:hypothetical protein